MPNVKVQIFQSCGSVAWLAKMITGAYGCGYCHAWLQNYVSTLEYCACAAEGKKQQCVCVTNLHIACKPHFRIARTTIKNNCWERHSQTLTLSSCSVNGNSVMQKRKAMIWHCYRNKAVLRASVAVQLRCVQSQTARCSLPSGAMIPEPAAKPPTGIRPQKQRTLLGMRKSQISVI